MDAYTVIEALSVAGNIVFLLLLMRQNRWCWPFGISGSALAVFLFVWPGAEVKLYSEAILYTYYVWIGFYGWMRWNKQGAEMPIKRWGTGQHLAALAVALVIAPSLGWLMDTFFHSNNPYVDAAVTVCAFVASYMQAEKVFTSWHVWIAVNAVSAWLYWVRGLEMYSGLMVVYVALSVAGLLGWRNDLGMKE